MAMKKESSSMKDHSCDMMCPMCKVPMNQCGCWAKGKVVKGLVLLVLGVLLLGNNLWPWASWFTLDHVFVVVFLLYGLKMFVWGCMSSKCH